MITLLMNTRDLPVYLASYTVLTNSWLGMHDNNSDNSMDVIHNMHLPSCNPFPLYDSTYILQCSRIESQRVFLQQVMTGEDKVAVIGCGCSLATESVAQISRFWNITQVCTESLICTCMGTGMLPIQWDSLRAWQVIGGSWRHHYVDDQLVAVSHWSWGWWSSCKYLFGLVAPLSLPHSLLDLVSRFFIGAFWDMQVMIFRLRVQIFLGTFCRPSHADLANSPPH